MFDTFPGLMDKAATLPGAIIAFFVIFMVHELGHYAAARLRNMQVKTFSIGLGRKLFSVMDRNGTEWIFRIFLLGGHVQIADLTLDDETQARRSVRTRLFVVLAGPAANLMLPFIILPLCFLLIGLPIRPPVISAVTIGSPAAEAGMQRGDIITRVNGIPISSYDELGDMIEDSRGEKLLIEGARQGEAIRFSVTPDHDIYRDIVNIPRDKYRIGVLNTTLPIPISFIHQIDNLNTKDSVDIARKKIIESFDRPIVIGMYNADDNVYFYPVTFSAAHNAHLNDLDHKYYERVYLGPLNDNLFLQLSPLDALQRGLSKAAELFGRMALVPFQIFPIDPELYSMRVPFLPESEHYIQSLIYRAAFQMALLSILIGFVNLIPFPRLDGDFVLTYLMEGYFRRKPSRRERAITIAVSLFLIYSVILLSNLGDLPGYLETKLDDWTKETEVQACHLPD